MEFLKIDPSRGSSPVLNVSDVAIALCTLWQEGSWEAALELSVSARKRKPQQVRQKRYRASDDPRTKIAGDAINSSAGSRMNEGQTNDRA